MHRETVTRLDEWIGAVQKTTLLHSMHDALAGPATQQKYNKPLNSSEAKNGDLRKAPENHFAKRESEHSPRAAGIAMVFLGGPHLMLIQEELVGRTKKPRGPHAARGPQVGDP